MLNLLSPNDHYIYIFLVFLYYFCTITYNFYTCFIFSVYPLYIHVVDFVKYLGGITVAPVMVFLSLDFNMTRNWKAERVDIVVCFIASTYLRKILSSIMFFGVLYVNEHFFLKEYSKHEK